MSSHKTVIILRDLIKDYGVGPPGEVQTAGCQVELGGGGVQSTVGLFWGRVSALDKINDSVGPPHPPPHFFKRFRFCVY